jgi:hypothetical protein
MLISINTASTKPTKHTKNVKAKDKASAHIKIIVIKIHTIEDIHIKENTKEAKKIKDSNKRNTMFITN